MEKNLLHYQEIIRYIFLSIIQKNMNKKAFSWITTLIVLMCVAFVALIVYLKFDALKTLILWEQYEKNDNVLTLQIWEPFSFSGTLTETQDLLDSSHYITHPVHGTVYIKSREYNLFDYTGKVLIQWEIERFLGDTPVVEVKRLTVVQTQTEDDVEQDALSETGVSEWGEDTRYNFPEMGIRFDEEFSHAYTITEQTPNKVVFQKSGEALTFSIVNFACQQSNDSKNCDTLVETFIQSAEQKIVNPIALTIYKLSEVKSWFFTNNKQWYYINNAPEHEVKQIANHLFVNNEWHTKNVILENLAEYCADEQVILHKYDTYTLKQENNKQYVEVEYNAKDTGKVFCKLELSGKEVLVREFTYDPYEEEQEKNTEDKTTWESEENQETSEKQSVNDDNKDTQDTDEIQQEDTNNEQKENEWDTQDTDFDITVEQIKLRPEKALTFNSARGHKITFPSPNIAYQEVTSSESFGQEGVHCFAELNVIHYKNQERVNETPDVQVYECNVKNSFDESKKNMIYKKVDTKHFVIKINNPAWYDFAQAVTVQMRD